MPGNRLKAKGAHNRRQYYGGLDHGESCSNADARSAAERHKGIARTYFNPICRKAIRIERIRIIPKTDVPMQRENWNVDACACGDMYAPDFHCVLRNPRDSLRNRIRPHES